LNGNEEDVDIVLWDKSVDLCDPVDQLLLLRLIGEGAWGVVDDPQRHVGNELIDLWIWDFE
jgi:hypothetical protein